MSHISIFVPNQQEALLFYTEKLRFTVHTDAAFGPTRWLTLVAPDAPDFEISLMEGTPVATNGAPVAAFITHDFYTTYNDMVAKGVTFITEPVEEPWGIGATFTDVAGNIFYLNQPKSLADMSRPDFQDPRLPI
jgi:catechol 2,3-dioxygenase-like lactoylglutathione lyase family enzyme